MKPAERQTRSHLMKLFERHGFHPRTRLGQNFLIDLNLVEFIVAEARLDKQDVVLEVGTGTGGMTTFLASSAAEVISVDVDSRMHSIARESTSGFDNVLLYHGDILKNKNRLSPDVLNLVAEKLSGDSDRRLKLVSNLPYSVATPVVSNLVATDLPWTRMVVTIQLELGQRMTAAPGSSHYGALSVWLQSQCSVRILKRLNPSVFWPRPRVNSAIVRLSPRPAAKAVISDRSFFHDFLRRLFHLRRKFLRSVVVGMYCKQLDKPDVDDVLQEFGISRPTRAEQLDTGMLVALSNRLHAAIQEQSKNSENQKCSIPTSPGV